MFLVLSFPQSSWWKADAETSALETVCQGGQFIFSTTLKKPTYPTIAKLISQW